MIKIPNQENAERHFDTVLPLVEKKLTLLLSKKRLPKHKKDFYIYLSDKKVLKEIISGEPETLKQKIDIISVTYPKICSSKELLDIFCYKSYDAWQAYQLANQLQINACTYCNRLYTITIGDDGDKITRPQFDHFFPKSKYPYLALSFYNLIPSCSTCNSSLKSDIDFNLEKFIHPYLSGFETNTRFTTIPSCYEDIVGLPPPKDPTGVLKIYLQLLIDKANTDYTKINNNIAVFKLDEIYSGHIDYVKELIRIRAITSNEYLKELAKVYNGLFDGKEELFRLAFGNYPNAEDYHKRPLAKLTKDIADELGLSHDSFLKK